MTFQRLSCGVATLHQSHPLSLKPENKTGWLGQYAPGLQRRPLTSRALLWCRYAPPQPPNLTQAREQNGVAGAEYTRNMGL